MNIQEQVVLQQAIDAYHRGDLKRSESILEAAIKNGFKHPQILYILGLAKSALNCHVEAAEILGRVVKKIPDHPEIWFHYGLSLANSSELRRALRAYDKALALKPNYVEVISNKGGLFYALNDLESSLDCANQLVELDSNNPHSWAKKGTTLKKLARYEEALDVCEKVLYLDPNIPEAWNEKGVLLSTLGKFDDVMACYGAALQLNPDYADPNWNRSLFLLLHGDLEKGLPLYEYRWQVEQVSSTAGKRIFGKPTWLGFESLKDKAILLYGEQGFGDFIQFSRYVRLFSELGARVILETPRPLVKLFANFSGVSQVLVQGEGLPHFDYQCPLLSLPLAFKTTFSNIPAAHSYLDADPLKVAEWALGLGAKTKIRVGVVWSSVSKFEDDGKRGLSLEEFVKALPADGFEYICLQKELKKSDTEFFESYKNIQFVGDCLQDFGDTAALITCLDLVITVDTAVAHLSGALGKKTWIVLPYVPDWRWFLHQETSPWYPTASLYRQSTLGDWDSALSKIKTNLNLMTDS